MVGKKGFLKTIEAVIAVFILLGFFIYMLPSGSENEASTPQNIQAMQDAILDEIISNEDYRVCLLVSIPVNCMGDIDDFILNTINPTEVEVYSYETFVCEDIGTCVTDLPHETDGKKVYAGDIIISDNGTDVVIFKLFIWLNE